MKKGRILLSSLIATSLIVGGCSSKVKEEPKQQEIKESSKNELVGYDVLRTEPIDSDEMKKIPLKLNTNLNIVKESNLKRLSPLKFTVTGVGLYEVTMKKVDNKAYTLIQLLATVENTSNTDISFYSDFAELTTETHHKYINVEQFNEPVIKANHKKTIRFTFETLDDNKDTLKTVEFKMKDITETKTSNVLSEEPIKILIDL